MVFVAPKLTAGQASDIINAVSFAARDKNIMFLEIMDLLSTNYCFRLMHRQPRINYCNRFNPAVDDATARIGQ